MSISFQDLEAWMPRVGFHPEDFRLTAQAIQAVPAVPSWSIQTDLSIRDDANETKEDANMAQGLTPVVKIPAVSNAPDEMRQGARRAAVRTLLNKAIEKTVSVVPDPRLVAALETQVGRNAFAALLSTALDAAPIPDRHRKFAGEISAELRVSSYDSIVSTLLNTLVILIEEASSEFKTLAEVG